MTIEEAIQHAREVALSNAACGVAYRKGGQTLLADSCDACAAEHEQLAEWLTELKQRREAEISAQPKTNADRIRQMSDEELRRFLNDIADNCSMQYCKSCPMNGACDDVPISMQKWLKQEVSEGVTD